MNISFIVVTFQGLLRTVKTGSTEDIFMLRNNLINIKLDITFELKFACSFKA